MNDSTCTESKKKLLMSLAYTRLSFLPDFVIERDEVFYLNVKNLFELQIS